MCRKYKKKKNHIKTWKGFQQKTYLLVMKIASGHMWPQFLHLTVDAVVPFNKHILLFF
jgi:hypothetical protein